MTSVADATGPVATLLARLEGVKAKGSTWLALCPAHDDKVQSLSIRTGADGRALAFCHAGCTFNAVVAAVGLDMTEMFPQKERVLAFAPPSADKALTAIYPYTDADGNELYQSVRYEPKTFRQRRLIDGGWTWSLGDVQPVLYRLPDVIEAIALGKRIYITEGEKDADALIREGFYATTNPMGAGKWTEAMSQVFKDASDVVILPDNDEPGRNHALLVSNSLMAVGATVRVVALPGLPEKGDVSDWLDGGGDFDSLEELIQATKPASIDRGARKFWYLDEVLANDDIMALPDPVVPRLAWKGRSTLLAAQVKGGKSTLMGYIAAQVSNGDRCFDSVCMKGPVLIVTLEEALGDTARRLKRFDAHPRRIRLTERLKGDSAAKIEELEAEIARVKPVLVIVDTLMAYGMGIVKDENSSAEMQPLVQALTDLAHRSGVAVLIVHHNTKGGGYRGSTAIAGAVDVMVEMTIPDAEKDQSRRKFHIVGRIPVHGFECRYMGTEYVMANAAGQPLIQRVIDFVRGNPRCSKRTVRDAVGGSHDGIDGAIVTLLQRRYMSDEGDEMSGCQYVADISAPASVDAMYGGSRND